MVQGMEPVQATQVVVVFFLIYSQTPAQSPAYDRSFTKIYCRPSSFVTHSFAHLLTQIVNSDFFHILTCSVNSCTDRFGRNAECPPLERWECDSWIPACLRSPTVFQDKPKQGGREIRSKTLSSMHSGLNRTKSWATEYLDALKCLLLLNHYLGTCRQERNRRTRS